MLIQHVSSLFHHCFTTVNELLRVKLFFFLLLFNVIIIFSAHWHDDHGLKIVIVRYKLNDCNDRSFSDEDVGE